VDRIRWETAVVRTVRWRVVPAGAAVLMLAGCFTSGVPDRLEHLVGVARVGDTHQVFVPLCPGEKTVSVKVSDRVAAEKALDVGYGDDAYTWWRAGGPRSASGPGEVLVLGDDEPFTDVAVRAGGNSAHPVLPAAVQVLLVATDPVGVTGRTYSAFAPAEVPSYPAGTDPAMVRYLLPGEQEPMDQAAIRGLSDCAIGPGPIPGPSTGPILGRQPVDSIRSGAAERVEKTLLGPAAITGMTAVAFDPPYVEDVAAHVCGNGPKSGAVSSVFGQGRVWDGGDREVRQFAGAYGAVTAAEAVTQVDGVLGCGDYTEYVTEYSGVHRAGLPLLSGIDQQSMFCETVDEKASRCTVLLARGDVLTRIESTAATEPDAAGVARTVAGQAAAALG
ncbi:MAG TPA: hypothetical protein VN408_19840, partial [Actinoplanes sp.]|nr:hypothetical protein [Actinoplanes sp.]